MQRLSCRASCEQRLRAIDLKLGGYTLVTTLGGELIEPLAGVTVVSRSLGTATPCTGFGTERTDAEIWTLLLLGLLYRLLS